MTQKSISELVSECRYGLCLSILLIASFLAGYFLGRNTVPENHYVVFESGSSGEWSDDECEDCDQWSDEDSEEDEGPIQFEPPDFGNLRFKTQNIDFSKHSQEYERGFNDAIHCMMLYWVELQLTGEKKTWGEMADVCRQRHNVVNKWFTPPPPPKLPTKED